MSKKKDKKKSGASDHNDELKRLRKENKELRARLEKIGRLAQELIVDDQEDGPELLNEEIVDVDHQTDGPIIVSES